MARLNLSRHHIDWPPKWPEPPHIPSPSDIVNNLKKALREGAASLPSHDVSVALQSFKEDAQKQLSEGAKPFVDAVEEVKKTYEQLTEQLDPNKIKRDLLRKAEEFCEAYLRDKTSLPPDLTIKTVPKVHLDFDLTKISIDAGIYIMWSQDDEGTYEQSYLVRLTFSMKQELDKPLQAPDLRLEANPNLEQNTKDKVMAEIDRQKDALIAQLIKSVLEDYVPPLKLLNDYLPIF